MTSCLGVTSYVVYIGDLDPVGSENDTEVFLNANVRTWGELFSMDENMLVNMVDFFEQYHEDQS